MPLSLFDVDGLVLAGSPALKSGLYIQWDYLVEKKYFIYEWLSFGDSFWVRGGDFSLLLISYRPCACCHRLCEFICVDIVMFWRAYLPGFPHQLCLLQYFSHSFRTRYCKISPCYMLSSNGSLQVFPICCRRKCFFLIADSILI